MERILILVLSHLNTEIIKLFVMAPTDCEISAVMLFTVATMYDMDLRNLGTTPR